MSASDSVWLTFFLPWISFAILFSGVVFVDGIYSHGVSKKDFAVGLVIVLLVSLALFAFVYSKVEQLSKPSDLSAKVGALEQRLAVLEEKIKPAVVKLRLLYDSTDAFAEPALVEVAAAQNALAQQGLAIELQDVAGKLSQVRKLGFYSLPVLYLSETEALKNPALYSAMQSQPRAEEGYRINALGFVTTSKSMIGLECKPGNSSARFYQFASFDCPACAALQPEVKKVLAEFGGKLEYRLRHYPTGDAPLSLNASQAVFCAGYQNKSSEFADKLFATALASGEWRIDSSNAPRGVADSIEFFKNYSKQLGLNQTEFSACLASSQKAYVDVGQDVTEADITYEFQSKAKYLPAFVLDCKNLFLATKPSDVKEGICRARPELCVNAAPTASANATG